MDHLASGEVVLPSSFENHFGWGQKNQTEQEILRIEQQAYDLAVTKQPALYTPRQAREWEPTLKQKFDDLMKSKGYDEGSVDLTCMEEMYCGKRMTWLPQKTGSCTLSNSFRLWVRTCIKEMLLKGQLEEPIGSTEYSSKSISFYVPLSYGIARQLGGLRGSDGGFCQETIKSLMMGVLPCSNGKLNEILTQLGATNDQDYPEPQNNAVYRKFQDWAYNDLLKPFLICPLVESVRVSDIDTLVEQLKAFKGAIQCSGIAIKKSGEHKGLTYYVRDKGNSWAHNMSWQGIIIWQGKVFLLLSNESWGPNIIYPIPIEEAATFFRVGVEIQTIGEIDLVDSTPLAW